MERVERRGSIARAFSRIRAAMKRRRPTNMHTAPNDRPDREDAATRARIFRSSENDIPVEQPAIRQTPVRTPSSNVVGRMPTDPTIAQDQRLEPDADENDETEELLLPMASHRPGFTDSKARDLFSRYGLRYDAERHIPLQEPPAKLRRVEKPIRVRVHWTCHSCRARFGLERVCAECGHRRCSQCSRHPPRRVKDVLEYGRYMMEQSDLSQQETFSSDEESKSSTNSSPAHSAIPSPSLELDSSTDAEDVVGLPSLDYPIFTRRGVPVRDFGHDHQRGRCEADRWTKDPFPTGEVPMMRAVQRVYRKPRQRVRYTCEHCTTLFLEGDRCRECGHERCINCVRQPPRRAPAQYDADILQLVTNRLAAHGGGFGLSPEVTAN